MTRQELERMFPYASESFIQSNCEGISAPEPERPKKRPLVRPTPGEATGAIRFEVLFRVHAVRPADYDNWRLKDLQDTLVIAGLLSSDDWRRLQGRVISEKVQTKEEERVEITVTFA